MMPVWQLLLYMCPFSPYFTYLVVQVPEHKELETPVLSSRLVGDMKLGIIPHPGVSALKKEHGILLQSRHNISDIGKGNNRVHGQCCESIRNAFF